MLFSCALMALVFSGAAGAVLKPLDVSMFAYVGPDVVFEKAPTDFSLLVFNNFDSTDSICHVNLTTNNFTVLNATNKVNWSYTINSWGISWRLSDLPSPLRGVRAPFGPR